MLIPDKVGMVERYHISCSFRKGATTQARIAGLSSAGIDLNNRWKIEQKQKGRQFNTDMIRLYTEHVLQVQLLTCFSRALWSTEAFAWHLQSIITNRALDLGCTSSPKWRGKLPAGYSHPLPVKLETNCQVELLIFKWSTNASQLLMAVKLDMCSSHGQQQAYSHCPRRLVHELSRECLINWPRTEQGF